MKNKTITAISAGTSYSMLKLTESSVDPYTRSAIGSILGFTLALSPNNNYRFIGIGTMIAGALQLIDVAKGVEPQTEKLVKVCRMRKTPIIVFINKMDREGKDAFDLLDEVEQKLNIKVRPLSWPIGMGKELKGVYNLYAKKLFLSEAPLVI